MKNLILRINGDLWDAVKFVLILLAFIILACWIEVPPLVDKCSHNEWKAQRTTVTQEIVSVRVADQK